MQYVSFTMHKQYSQLSNYWQQMNGQLKNMFSFWLNLGLTAC